MDILARREDALKCVDIFLSLAENSAERFEHQLLELIYWPVKQEFERQSHINPETINTHMYWLVLTSINDVCDSLEDMVLADEFKKEMCAFVTHTTAVNFDDPETIDIDLFMSNLLGGHTNERFEELMVRVYRGCINKMLLEMEDFYDSPDLVTLFDLV